MTVERLQKVLSQAGLGSRRDMERLIELGVVKVNGTKASLGDKVSAQDSLMVRGQRVANPLKDTKQIRVLLYHKPIGEISSRHDPKHNRTVFDNLPRIHPGRWIQVGRLDINTSGLLVFTNDGTLANTLMHPRYELEREYAVRVHGTVTPTMIDTLLKGVPLDGQPAKFERIAYHGGDASNQWYHVVLKEGRNREVRRLWETQGMEVSRLIRIRFGSIRLPKTLRRGECIEWTPEQVKAFLGKLPKASNQGPKA